MKLRQRFITQKVGDDVMAVSPQTGEGSFSGIIKLNETGAFLLERLNDPVEAPELVAALEEHFGAPPERAAADLEAFLQALRSADLLEE